MELSVKLCMDPPIYLVQPARLFSQYNAQVISTIITAIKYI